MKAAVGQQPRGSQGKQLVAEYQKIVVVQLPREKAESLPSKGRLDTAVWSAGQKIADKDWKVLDIGGPKEQGDSAWTSVSFGSLGPQWNS